jgi:hypothetical protein
MSCPVRRAPRAISRRARCAVLAAALVFSVNATAQQSTPSAGPTLAYRLTYDAEKPGARWEIEIEGTGLASIPGPLELRLDDWGEWTQVDSYHLPFLTCDPPIERAEDARDRFTLQIPAAWDGRLRARYAISVTELGSNAREAHGLLPFRAPTYCMGFSSNTLMELESGGKPTAAQRTVSIVVSSQWTIATGFGGVSSAHQTALVPGHFRNSAISFGRPVAFELADEASQPIEIVQ